jgi:ribosome-associated protein
MNRSLDYLPVILSAAEEKKAAETIVLDMSKILEITDFFIITSGTSKRQTKTIAENIEEKLFRQFSLKPISVEGYSDASWILMDYGDFIVHVFEDEMRRFYDLERLWISAPVLEIKPA